MRHRNGIETLKRAVLTTPGDTDPELRQTVFDRNTVDEPLRSYLQKVSEEAYRVLDRDVEGLLASGMSEDAVFELTLVAALRECVDRYARGTRDLR